MLRKPERDEGKIGENYCGAFQPQNFSSFFQNLWLSKLYYQDAERTVQQWSKNRGFLLGFFSSQKEIYLFCIIASPRSSTKRMRRSLFWLEGISILLLEDALYPQKTE